MSDTKISQADPGQDPQLYLITLMGILAMGSVYLRPFYGKALEFSGHHSALLTVCWIGIAISAALACACVLWNRYVALHLEDEILSQDGDSVYLGREIGTQKQVHLKASFRTMHTELIGTTNAGKTGSVMAPWTFSDVELA